MNIIQDLHSIRWGEALASKHVKMVQAWEAYHECTHDANDDWDCSVAGQAFYASLTDEIVVSGYEDDRIANAAYRRALTAAQEAGLVASAPKVSVIPIELEELDGETPEHYMERLQRELDRAAADHDAFERITENFKPIAKPGVLSRIASFFSTKGTN